MDRQGVIERRDPGPEEADMLGLIVLAPLLNASGIVFEGWSQGLHRTNHDLDSRKWERHNGHIGLRRLNDSLKIRYVWKLHRVIRDHDVS